MPVPWRATMLAAVLLALLAGSVMAVGVGGAAAAIVGRAGVRAAAVDTAAVAYQVDPAHDGHQADPQFAAPLTRLWSVNVGGGGAGDGYPLIVNGLVYVDVPNAGGYGTSVSAYSLDDGTLTWGPINLGGPRYGFGALAYEGGRVFAINLDGKLTALDGTSGAIDWSELLPGQFFFTAPPTAIGGTVYVSGAGSGGTLYALDETTGASRWTASVANGDRSAPAVDATGVYVSYSCERAYSFTTAGSLLWQHNPGCDGGGGRTDVLHDGRDYVRDNSNAAPVVLSESTGATVGSFTSDVAPAFDGSTMFTLAGSVLSATDVASGATLWTNSDGPYVTAPLVVNGYVIEGDSGGTVHLIDEGSGVPAWNGSAGTVIYAPDEYSGVRLSGIAEAEGHLAVPAGDTLTVFGPASAPRVHITSGPQDGTFVGAAASFAFTSNETNPTYSCALDGATPVACTSPISYTPLSDGAHTFTVTAGGPDGTSLPAIADFVADRVTPVPVVLAPTQPFSRGPDVAASWAAYETGSGVASYDVRYRSAPLGGAFGNYVYPPGLQATTLYDTSIGGAPGDTVCFSVRARDNVGNQSGWSAPACTSLEIDDRALAASTGWTRGQGAQYLDGTYTSSSVKGATLTLTGVRADRLALFATVCNGCGKVAITFPGRPKTVIDLQSTSTYVATFSLPALSKVQTGTVTLTVSSNRHPVQVDAIGASQA